ncbi:MAG TPA: L-threonylcarbamoyladenylate synthase [Thermoanaerobaculia bacterium]
MLRRWAIQQEPSAADVGAIAEVLRGGGVVLLPTDTIYGLHAVATDDRAVGRIAAMKGRDEAKPFVVIGASMQQLRDIGVEFPERANEVLQSLWPAPLTAILPLRLPVAASRGAATLAVRVPDLDWLRALVAICGPLASTSANLSGEPAVETPEMLSHGIQTSLDGIVDGGPLKGEPSVIVDFTGDSTRITREGDTVFTQKVWKTLRKYL